MNICFADGRPMLNKEILKDKSVLALEFWGQACFIHVFKKEKKSIWINQFFNGMLA